MIVYSQVERTRPARLIRFYSQVEYVRPTIIMFGINGRFRIYKASPTFWVQGILGTLVQVQGTGRGTGVPGKSDVFLSRGTSRGT